MSRKRTPKRDCIVVKYAPNLLASDDPWVVARRRRIEEHAARVERECLATEAMTPNGMKSNAGKSGGRRSRGEDHQGDSREDVHGPEGGGSDDV